MDRYFRVQNFIPEPFWGIKVTHRRDDISVVFNWARNRLFDRAAIVILFERCIAAKTARVSKVQEKPTSKWKPLPLTTVELQKVASRLLRMTSQQAMTIAESLYNKGFISYPRTETDRFDKGMNLRALVEKQTQDSRWGTFAQNLVNGAFKQPREGRNDDKAHPPIHPIAYCAPAGLRPEEARLYEFITRRFLACCSEDAKGKATDVELEYGDEVFHTRGLIVLERNYLDVYPYENWTNSTILPTFTVGERFEPTEAMITDGQTSAPSYLTEPDLIALMDANGIGTDATMAEHIAKIKNRNYVFTRPRAGGGRGGGNEGIEAAAAGRRARGGRGGRGGRRGGAAGGGDGGGNGVEEFIPSTLGVALVEGYDRMGLETSLSKPFLRKELELRLKAICEGRISRAEVMRESVRQYKSVFLESQERVELLKAVRDMAPSLNINDRAHRTNSIIVYTVLPAIRAQRSLNYHDEGHNRKASTGSRGQVPCFPLTPTTVDSNKLAPLEGSLSSAFTRVTASAIFPRRVMCHLPFTSGRLPLADGAGRHIMRLRAGGDGKRELTVVTIWKEEGTCSTAEYLRHLHSVQYIQCIQCTQYGTLLARRKAGRKDGSRANATEGEQDALRVQSGTRSGRTWESVGSARWGTTARCSSLPWRRQSPRAKVIENRTEDTVPRGDEDRVRKSVLEEAIWRQARWLEAIVVSASWHIGVGR